MNRLKLGIILLTFVTLGAFSAWACPLHCPSGNCDAAQGEVKPANS